MGGSATTQLTVAKALETAKENQNGQIPTAVTAILERNITDIWRKIRAQPTSFVMTKEQFTVFNYYRGRYENDPVAKQAVARFWDHYKGDPPAVDGAQSTSSSNPSTPTSSSRGNISSSSRTSSSR